ncbi:MAG: hypothetical protein GWN62_21205, partial [Aliifodinibius sp.]|nr:hypothetical protein [Nitrosopumilaceae archaeon]NIV13702.1 hypothetical protein [Fodinibius sp.]NIX61967.1 hypothetical protein [Nitrosopumilaceae archaeon]
LLNLGYEIKWHNFDYCFFTTVWGKILFKVYFNAIRADDANVDDAEYVELVGPAGTDITGFRIAHHNGVNGVDGIVWNHMIFFGLVVFVCIITAYSYISDRS